MPLWVPSSKLSSTSGQVTPATEQTQHQLTGTVCKQPNSRQTGKCIRWLLLGNECIIYADSLPSLLLGNVSASLSQAYKWLATRKNRLCLSQTLCSANKAESLAMDTAVRSWGSESLHPAHNCYVGWQDATTDFYL